MHVVATSDQPMEGTSRRNPEAIVERPERIGIYLLPFVTKVTL